MKLTRKVMLLDTSNTSCTKRSSSGAFITVLNWDSGDFFYRLRLLTFAYVHPQHVKHQALNYNSVSLFEIRHFVRRRFKVFNSLFETMLSYASIFLEIVTSSIGFF